MTKPKTKAETPPPEQLAATAPARTISPEDIPALRAAKLENVNEVVMLLARGELHEGDARLDAALVWADFPDRVKLAQTILATEGSIASTVAQLSSLEQRSAAANEECHRTRKIQDEAEAALKAAQAAHSIAGGHASALFAAQSRLGRLLAENRSELVGMRAALAESPLRADVLAALNGTEEAADEH